MGLEIVVPHLGPCRLAPLLDALAAAGLPSAVAMVDGALRPAQALPPDEWREVRLRTPAGMVALRRHPGGIAVVVFGNADAALQFAQRTVVDTLRTPPGGGRPPA